MSASGTLNSSQQLADRRAATARTAPPVSMFGRMLWRAAVLRRRRAASALLAMVVAAAVATALLNLYVDVQSKLRNEFRNYGANLVIVAKEDSSLGTNEDASADAKNSGRDWSSLPADTLAKVRSTLGDKGLAVPFSYVVARTADGRSVAVVGTDLTRARQLNHWWKVSRWPDAPDQALVGMSAAAVVAPNRQPFELSFQGKSIRLSPAGMLQTGAGEDSRVYLDQTTFQNWTGISPSTIEVAASGTAAEVQSSIKQLEIALPDVDIRPVRQIMEGEAHVLNKTRATIYAASALVILTSTLCVLSTLMGWVLDRRRDFAIMKALGASERLVTGFFAAEAVALGVVGAVFGFLIGIGIAVWIGRVNFHAPVVPRFSIFPYVLIGSIVITLIAAVVPIGLLRRVHPATMLRGE